MRMLPMLLIMALSSGAWPQNQRMNTMREQPSHERAALERERPTPPRVEQGGPPTDRPAAGAMQRPALGIFKGRQVPAAKLPTPPVAASAGAVVRNPVAGAALGAAAGASLAMTEAGRHNMTIEADRSSQARAQASQLPDSVYRRRNDASLHRELLTRVDDTARLVAQRANALPPRDLALSRYYISSANAEARRVNQLASQRSIGSEDLERLRSTVEPVRAMQARLARGETPFERRQVTVTVRNADGGQPAPPLRVYVLPAGLIDNPDEPALIRELLGELSFERLTSPSTGTVPGGEMRLWVGPDFQYDAMAKMVVERRLTRYTPVHGHLSTEPDPNLLFVAPGGVTFPGP